jgi:hypothetical protein
MSVFVNPLKSSKAKFKEEMALQIFNHKKTIVLLEEAIKSHKEAIALHEAESHELAALSTIEAINQLELALERQKRLIKSTL